MTGISIIIRTRNEVHRLEPVLAQIKRQEGDFDIEVILVDSYSADGTLEVAEKYRCKVIQLPVPDFSWGRALNLGLESAKNECCVLLSGHCHPVDRFWLSNLLLPLNESTVAATCGRQIPQHGIDPFEEAEIERWFPAYHQNNSFLMFTSANSAIKRSLWKSNRFNETLNSLEDADSSTKFRQSGFEIRYVPDAIVYHSHPISVSGIYRRWYWRNRTAMYLRKDSNPKIKKAAHSRFSSIVVSRMVLITLGRYFYRSGWICLSRGYLSQIWKLPFYEIVRESAIYNGFRDGLKDVKSNIFPESFCYFQSKIPQIIRQLRFIE